MYTACVQLVLRDRFLIDVTKAQRPTPNAARNERTSVLHVVSEIPDDVIRADVQNNCRKVRSGDRCLSLVGNVYHIYDRTPTI